MSRSVGRICAGFYLAVSLVVSYIVFGSSVSISEPGLSDLPVYILIGLHYLWGITLLLSSTEYREFSRGAYRRLLFVPEMLAAGSLLLFLFSYIFATNANMDYVQRFIASGGNLRLALDTNTERLLVWVRIFPLVALDAGVYFLLRFGRYKTVIAATHQRDDPERIVRPWAFALTLAGAFLVTIGMPSFLDLDGFPLLGWIGFVPIFLVLRSSRPGHALFYGVTFGVFQTLLSSYWLGTFSLVSLQITVLFFLIYYLVFTPLVVHARRVARWARVLVFPLAWTLFEYLRSSGFLGYPWALAGHSQYAALPVIQIASLTGVWGVSFVVLLANSAIAEFLGSVFSRVSAERSGMKVARAGPRSDTVRRSLGSLTVVAAVLGVIVLSSSIILASGPGQNDNSRTVRVAQVQQNNDPRKFNYEDTLDTLTRLTDSTLSQSPDLIVWSETAFVPNIRRWSVDTSSSRYHRLVTEFIDYQRGLRRWLVTGNDDYEIVTTGDDTQRLEYNAAILFSDKGERVETYRKIQLVPFTEHFPYREQFPAIYDLLLDFDVNFWEPGETMTVFEHPLVRFSTPICYEDVFPNYVRQFVAGGAEAIFNISNDYWSLTEVQAKQHFVAGLFRAVENRRPVLRTTASGLTGQIDIYGRTVQTAPYYEQAVIVSDVTLPADPPTTIYTRLGDVFPLAAGVLLVVIWGTSFVPVIAGRVKNRRANRKPRQRREAPKTTPAESPKDEAVKDRTLKDKPRTSRARVRPGPKRARNRQPLRALGKPLGGRRRKRAKRPKTNWRKIWDR